ncbi:protein containing cyclic nucleotide-binding domain [Sulfurimonas gotlandica GD1]|uniref:Protein containing cyclic nucleotide-binding domain n=1 Tax=Sulfurimonas gotlandica (strain DSM 19862 / JCM 16533 / GD1) TaxID=929558 RepID=B6BIZ6_SULGG|nr:cyclic nucleotide-binding protein [Sulfurimonas gotlandica]EDZ62909.1 hypothetical protein CBGD1_527 [Sulfurimonas gotlandica GD1]EHP30509.1 protein containing cyclic nucleotide-binding domain [Sulfurimonas gotlandica GD1]
MDLETILQEFPIYNKLSPSELRSLISFIEVLEFEKDEIIFSVDEPFDYIATIYEGNVDYYVYNTEEDKVVRLGSYKRYPVGVYNVSTKKSPGIEIVATEKTILLAIHNNNMKKIEKLFPRIGMHLYKGIIKAQNQILQRLTTILIKHRGQKVP